MIVNQKILRCLFYQGLADVKNKKREKIRKDPNVVDNPKENRFQVFQTQQHGSPYELTEAESMNKFCTHSNQTASKQGEGEGDAKSQEGG